MNAINDTESKLFPNSPLPQAEKFKLAWDGLNSRDHNVRANCMTWLTYRAIEREIPFTEWQSKVQYVPLDESRISKRWIVSLKTAACYVKILNGEIDEAHFDMWFLHKFDYSGLPFCILNFLRVSSILARSLVAEPDECKRVIARTLEHWKATVAGVDLLKEPSWVADGGFNGCALHHLLRTAEMVGMTSFRPDQSVWVDEFTEVEKFAPWMRCLTAVTKKADAKQESRITFLTVLKTGGEYTAAHVERVRAMLLAYYGDGFRFLCLTDDPAVDQSIRCPLIKGWPGWWSKLELFMHDFGRCCYLDLDITITDSIAWIDDLPTAAGEFYAMEDAMWPNTINSSFMLWSGARVHLLNGFSATGQPVTMPNGQGNSDQVWINERIGPRIYVKPPQVGSFKIHGEDSSSIVVYHGKPKPWDL